jgi:hypothetical protein
MMFSPRIRLWGLSMAEKRRRLRGRDVTAEQAGTAAVLVGADNLVTQIKQSADELAIIHMLEKDYGRKLTPQEINLALEHARQIGQLERQR